jgi:hypothetical protein
VDKHDLGYSRKRSSLKRWMPSELIVRSTGPDQAYPMRAP